MSLGKLKSESLECVGVPSEHGQQGSGGERAGRWVGQRGRGSLLGKKAQPEAEGTRERAHSVRQTIRVLPETLGFQKSPLPCSPIEELV